MAHTNIPSSCNERMARLFVSTEEILGLVHQTGFACTAFFAR